VSVDSVRKFDIIVFLTFQRLFDMMGPN